MTVKKSRSVLTYSYIALQLRNDADVNFEVQLDMNLQATSDIVRVGFGQSLNCLGGWVCGFGQVVGTPPSGVGYLVRGVGAMAWLAISVQWTKRTTEAYAVSAIAAVVFCL